MKRNALIQLLHDYSALGEEVEFKKSMLEFVKNHVDCFERSLECGHITASSWLINKTSSKALLMHHAKLDQWFQLGGHCDGHPDVLATAIREAQEESGISQIYPLSTGIFDLDIHLIPENHKEKAHYHYDVRFLLQSMSEEVICNKESKEMRWIEKKDNELPTKNLSLLRMFHKWMQLQ